MIYCRRVATAGKLLLCIGLLAVLASCWGDPDWFTRMDYQRMHFLSGNATSDHKVIQLQDDSVSVRIEGMFVPYVTSGGDYFNITLRLDIVAKADGKVVDIQPQNARILYRGEEVHRGKIEPHSYGVSRNSSVWDIEFASDTVLPENFRSRTPYFGAPYLSILLSEVVAFRGSFLRIDTVYAYAWKPESDSKR